MAVWCIQKSVAFAVRNFSEPILKHSIVAGSVFFNQGELAFKHGTIKSVASAIASFVIERKERRPIVIGYVAGWAEALVNSDWKIVRWVT